MRQRVVFVDVSGRFWPSRVLIAPLLWCLAGIVHAAGPAPNAPQLYAPPNMLSAKELTACVQSEDELDQRRQTLFQEKMAQDGKPVSPQQASAMTAKMNQLQADRRGFTAQCRTRPYMLADWQAAKEKNRIAMQKNAAKAKKPGG